MNFGKLIVVDNKIIMMKKLYRTGSRARLLLIPYEFLVATGHPEYVKIELDKKTNVLRIIAATEEEANTFLESYLK